MTKRRGVTGKDKATKAAKTTKTIRTYVANSSRDYNKERDERREEGSEHEQDNLHGQDVDIGEDMLSEQEERNIEKERRENEKKEMERRDKERREKERREKERREKERREKERRERIGERGIGESKIKNKKKMKMMKASEEEIPVQFGAMTNQLQICNCEYTESSDPTDEEVNNFISREVVLKRILSRYVSAIDFTKLSETSLDKLIEFSRKCFKIVWVETESANIKEKVKELDVITEDLEIPSCSGRNIASSLKLHLFS
ncbi:protein split ends isoform X4 [Rhizophagus irregularis DAOM 181602=DAOM 197198]|nr:protein split ends isoform X4 [Rhizophagus irregularis DAOM 181602=DAOM 197198]